VSISYNDAMSSVHNLKEYVMQHTETFGVSLCHVLDDVEKRISATTINRKSQADIRALVGAETR
jgi:hypothetical protein